MIRIDWLVNNICNYNCFYCSQQTNRLDPNLKDFDLKYTDRICQNLLALPAKKFDVNMIGGETTLYPHLKNLMNKILLNFKDKLSGFVIVTNGSQPKEYWNQFKDYDRLEVTISLHLDKLNNHHYQIIDYLINNNFKVFVAIMYQPSKKELIKDIIKFVDERKDKLGCDCNQIIKRGNNMLWFDQNDEDRELIASINNKYSLNKDKKESCQTDFFCEIHNYDVWFCRECHKSLKKKIPIGLLSSNKFQSILSKETICPELRKILVY